MRRNVRRHADGDTAGAVHQQMRETCRKHGRLLLRLIKVGNKVHGIFTDIRGHFHGNFTQSRLGITHGRCAIAVHGTEVAVSIHQRVTGVEILCQLYQSVIDGTVAMRVIFTHGIADDTRALSVRLVRPVVQFDHGI